MITALVIALAILALLLIAQSLAFIYFMRRNRVTFKDFPDDTAAILEQTISRLDAQYRQLETIEATREQRQDAFAQDLHAQWQQLLHNLHDSTESWERGLAASEAARDDRYNQFVRAIADAHRTLESKQTDMVQQVTELSEFTGEYRQSYRRFQDGYDFKILKGFLSGLLRIIDDSNYRIATEQKHIDEVNGTHSSSEQPLNFARSIVRDLEIFLENHGVETYYAQDGEHYAGNERAYKVAHTENAPYPELGGIIKTTLMPGYHYVEGNAPRVLQPAEVVLYRTIPPSGQSMSANSE